MRMIAFVLIATGFAVGCGGGPETPPASTSSPAASQPATPSVPEPPREIPASTFANLHGAPAPSDADRRELYDVSRDLQAIAAGEASATQDLADDLKRFVPAGGPQPDTTRIAQSVTTAVKGRTLDESAAQRLTAALYVTLHGDDMNASQHAAAAGQLRDILGSIGAPKAQADAVVSQMPQAAVR